MERQNARFQRIVARVKNNPIVTSVILFGTVVIALSTFTDAVKNLLSFTDKGRESAPVDITTTRGSGSATPPGDKVREPAPVDMSDTWKARVTYGWGHAYEEHFTFKVHQDELFGTASFLGRGRGIQKGQIKGDEISFLLKLEELLGSETRSYTQYYKGRISQDEIHFVMQDDRGNPPVEFTARRSAN
jgi:hypothetical protein